MPAPGRKTRQPRPPASRATLLRQNRELRRRLTESEQQREEATQTLETIRAGGVDALVVGGQQGARIFTLQGAEQPYRLLVETVNAGALTLDRTGTILYANRHAARLLNLRLEQLIGSPLEKLVVPDDLPTFGPLLATAQAGEAAGEIRLQPVAHPPVPVHLALRHLQTAGEEMVCVVLTDLTERQQAEDALRQANAQLEARVADRTAVLAASEAKFAALFENSPVGIILSTLEGRILAMNRAMLELSGYEAEEVRGRTVAELDAWVDAERRDEFVRHLQTEGRVRDFEVALRKKSGEMFRVILSGQLLTLAGTPLIVSAALDVTERKRIEAELRESEAKFARAFAANPAALALTRLADGRFLEVNDTYLHITGYRRDEVIGRTAVDLGAWADPVGRARFVDALHRARSIRGWEERFRKKSGEEFIAVLSAEVIEVGGEPVVLSTFLDITARKQMEEALRASLGAKDDALATNQALLREVHHRVKNNLQMLCDMLYLQMEGIGDDDKAAVLGDAYARIYAVARLHETLYSAMQSGRVQLGEYLRRLLDGLESLYPAVPVLLYLEKADVALDLDRGIHVGLIVNELVSNSLKYAFPRESSGEVRVSVRRLGEQVQLQVRDNGRGLPPDLDIAQTKSLGLRIVQILSTRLHGTLTMESHGGAAFTLTFPLDGEPAVEPQ